MKIEDLPIPEQVKRIVVDTGISELYPPQEDAILAGALEGKNFVLASPTASGKTLIAELCALKHILERDGKVLYLTPLRALANEKFDDFKKYTAIKKKDGRRVSIGITTGDYDNSDPWLGRRHIIITTNEKADSLLRHRAKWVDEISLIVADEVHLINDAERGPTLEVVLARLMQTNPDAQLLALSATIRNAEEAAEWLKAESITTKWRPVTLREGVLLHDEAQFNDGAIQKIKKQTQNPAVNLALHIMKLGGQALIFAGTRRTAVSLAKNASRAVKKNLSKSMIHRLSKVADRVLTTGEQTRINELLADLVKQGAAFHHAGLSGTLRRIIEDAFREGKIKVLAATPTLSFGVNLPARMVVLYNYRRYEPGYGYYPIAVLEYKQMAGRAGRPSYDKVGEALLIAKTEDERDYLLESYIFAEPERIWSKLGVERILRSHVLATISSDFAHTEQGIYDFFGRTFYAYQYDARAIKGVITNILKFLFKERMVDVDGENIYATKFGRRVSELYIDPVSAVMIREALLSRALKLTNLSFFHMMAHTPDMYPKLRPNSREIDDLFLFVDNHRDEFMFKVPDMWMDRIDYEEFLGEVKLACVLNSWVEEATEDEIIERFRVQPGDLYRLIETTRWLLYASHELAILLRCKDFTPQLAELKERIISGVKAELLPLVRLKGIGRVRARILYDSGLKTIGDLKRTPLKKLTELPLIGTKLAKTIKEQVGGFIRSSDWQKLKESKAWEQQVLKE